METHHIFAVTVVASFGSRLLQDSILLIGLNHFRPLSYRIAEQIALRFRMSRIILSRSERQMPIVVDGMSFRQHVLSTGGYVEPHKFRVLGVFVCFLVVMNYFIIPRKLQL